MSDAILGNYPNITALCLEAFGRKAPVTPLALAEALMGLPELSMHCPEHHYILPAALLTCARRAQGADLARLEKDLKTAEAQAKKVPGGQCGFAGCCGAAVGAGIFAAVLLGGNPKQAEGWRESNLMTARCLEHIAQSGGPRCCKRVTYLALEAALPLCKTLLGTDLGDCPAIVCHRMGDNHECLGTACPFFPVGGAA